MFLGCRSGEEDNGIPQGHCLAQGTGARDHEIVTPNDLEEGGSCEASSEAEDFGIRSRLVSADPREPRSIINDTKGWFVIVPMSAR